ASAGKGPGSAVVPRVGAREEAVVGADAIVEHDSFASTELALAPRLGIERELIDVEPVAGFGDLGRAIERVAVDRAEQAAVTVAATPLQQTIRRASRVRRSATSRGWPHRAVGATGVAWPPRCLTMRPGRSTV